MDQYCESMGMTTYVCVHALFNMPVAARCLNGPSVPCSCVVVVPLGASCSLLLSSSDWRRFGPLTPTLVSQVINQWTRQKAQARFYSSQTKLPPAAAEQHTKHTHVRVVDNITSPNQPPHSIKAGLPCPHTLHHLYRGKRGGKRRRPPCSHGGLVELSTHAFWAGRIDRVHSFIHGPQAHDAFEPHTPHQQLLSWQTETDWSVAISPQQHTGVVIGLLLPP
jgi:hypothetical protein